MSVNYDDTASTSLSTQVTEESKPATQQWLSIHLDQINNLVRELICPTCLNCTGLQGTIDSANQGFCSSVMLQCTHCQEGDKYRKSVYTSTRLQDSTRGDVAFDINVRMVLLAHELGLGYRALKKISKVLGIPSMHLKSYQRHDKKVTGKYQNRNVSIISSTLKSQCV